MAKNRLYYIIGDRKRKEKRLKFLEEFYKHSRQNKTDRNGEPCEQ